MSTLIWLRPTDESAAGIGDDVALGADEERLREGCVADTADDGAAACGVVGKNANEVFEIAGEAGGVGVGFECRSNAFCR